MALANYSELQSEALDWMERAGQSGKAPTWIKVAEARLNRDVGVVETSASLTGTINDRSVDVSSLSVVRPLDLFLTEPGGDEVTVQMQPTGKMPFDDTPAQPEMYELRNSGSIIFNRPCDEAYALRFVYLGRFALSDSAPTNDLLTNHPDIYLAATLMWGAGYNQDWQNGAAWKAVLDEELPKVRNLYRKSQRGTSRVDPALLAMGGMGRYNIESDT